MAQHHTMKQPLDKNKDECTDAVNHNDFPGLHALFLPEVPVVADVPVAVVVHSGQHTYADACENSARI